MAQQDQSTVRVHHADKADLEPARPWAQKFLDYAKLSALVYRHVADNVTPPPTWTQSPDPKDVLDDPQTSLYFEVWENLAANPVEVAVAFRGTHELKDWWTNARWITRFIPIGWDQYDLVRREIPNVVARARARHPNASITTTGHSLGGGLAQQAAYAHSDIKYVVAFDPSPVTGYRSVPEPPRTTNQQAIIIFRVYEHGEILAYFRTFMRRLLPLSVINPSITEVRFNLTRGGDAVGLHSMVALATVMAQAAAPA